MYEIKELHCTQFDTWNLKRESRKFDGKGGRHAAGGPTCNSNSSSSAWKSLPASLLALIQLFKMLHATLCVYVCVFVCAESTLENKARRFLPCYLLPLSYLASTFYSKCNLLILHAAYFYKAKAKWAKSQRNEPHPGTEKHIPSQPLPSLPSSISLCLLLQHLPEITLTLCNNNNNNDDNEQQQSLHATSGRHLH